MLCERGRHSETGHGVATHPRHFRRLAALGAVTVAALTLGAGPVAAGGDPPRPDDHALVSVYMEIVPQASGPRADVGGGGERRPLPPGIESRIDRLGGEDARPLKDLATAERYGAPQEPILPIGPREAPGLAAALSGVASATGDDGGGGLGLLIVALAFVTASLATAALLRRRA